VGARKLGAISHPAAWNQSKYGGGRPGKEPAEGAEEATPWMLSGRLPRSLCHSLPL